MADLTQLTDDLYTWLETASLVDIHQYASKLPEDRQSLIQEIRPEIVLSLRVARRRAFEEQFSCNALDVMPERAILTFFDLLTRYSIQSVLATTRASYPNLQCGTDPEFGTWAKKWLLNWRHAFYLFSAARFLRTDPYVKSFIKMAYAEEYLIALGQQISQLLGQLTGDIAQHDYKRYKISTQQQTEIKETLKAVGFLPEQYVDELLQGESVGRLYQLFAALEVVLVILQTGNRVGLEPADEEGFSQLLWDELRFREEVKEVAVYDREWEAAHHPIDDPLYQRFQDLFKLVTIQKIEDGSCLEALRTYLSKLNPEQKKQFLSELQEFFIQSPDLQAIFEPVDIEYFIEQIKFQSMSGNKADFINSLEEKVLPEFWPITQKAMLMIANFY